MTLVTARQPCNLLSQLSTCVDVEHSLCVQCVQTCTHTILYAPTAVAMHEVPYGSYTDCGLVQMYVCIQLAGHMSKLCLSNCTYITITTATIHRLAFWPLLNSLAYMLWCSGAISSVCILALYVLTLLPITSLLTYMDRFDVVPTLVSRVSLHAMYTYGTHIRLNSGSLTSCHVRSRYCCASYQLWSTGSQLWMHPVCHSDGLLVSTGCGIPFAVPTHACTPVVLSPSFGIPWTCGTCVGSTGPFS